MTIELREEILAQAGLTPREALIEFACQLFDAERLTLWLAAQLAGLSRVEFEIELRKRGIAVYRPTPDEFAGEAKSLGLAGA